MNNVLTCETMVCRGCLSSGRMYSIQGNRLADLYCTLIGENISVTDCLPQYLCHICRALLLKYARFKKKCLESQHFLLQTMKDNLELSRSNLSTCRLTFSTYVTTATQTTQYTNENEDEIAKTPIENMHSDDDLNIKEEDASSPVSIKCDEGLNMSVTEDATSNLISNSSNIKNKKKLKQNGNRRVVENEFISESGKTYKRAQRLHRIKGKYFETKENMVTFESLYDVEIVVLTKEQQLRDVLERKESCNYQNGPFKCEECYRGFINRDNFIRHYKAQHDPSRGDIVCEFCRFRYKDKRGLTQHLKRHRLKFVCRQCKYVSRTTFNAKEHFKTHAGQMHECKECGKSYERLSTYLTHVRIHHPDELAWCELCGESFIGEFGLNGHRKRAHRDLKLPVECARCGARFTSAPALETHAGASRRSPCDKASSCAHCGRTLGSPVALRDHLLKSHRVDAKHYECCKCNKRFSRESLYSAHYRRMHAEDPARRTSDTQRWVCEVCGKTMPNKCRLVYHQRNHTGERPYQCPDCPKSFTMNKLLRSHARVHSTDRPFACKYCPKTFKGPSALKGHETVHIGDRVKLSTRKLRS